MWTFGQKDRGRLRGGLRLLAVVGFAGYRSIDALTKTSYRGRPHASGDGRNRRPLAAVDGRGDGSAGFVITGDDTFLERYLAGIAAVNSRGEGPQGADGR